jgi:hypothetical protein
MAEWTYFVKIVAVPTGSYPDLPEVVDVWGDSHLTYYTSTGEEIGLQIWGSFAIIQDVYNNPCEDYEGLQYKSEIRSGLGNWGDVLPLP